jgi:serine/threonine protein kinase
LAGVCYSTFEAMSGAAVALHAGKYEPLFELGRGGMSTVLLAVHRGPHGFVKLQVIKKLKPELAQDSEFLRMFQEEARLAARINHRNVVQTNETGFHGNEHFIAMEYLDGQSFETILRRSAKIKRPFPLPLQLRIVADALEGLHHAHELRDFDGSPLNPVHRDVSPHNIFVTYEGQVKVVDFGIAKAADCDIQTRTGVIKGKVPYMSPEQLGGATLDRRADLFSVGVILWRVLTGVRLWRGLSDMEVIVRVERGEIPSPSTVRADLPPALVAICKKSLARHPGDRYQTAAELQAAIDNYLEQSGQRTTNRSIGLHLCDMFRENREKVAQAIEERLRSSDTSDVVPALSTLTAVASETPSITQPLEQAFGPIGVGREQAPPSPVAKRAASGRGKVRLWVAATTLLAVVVGTGYAYERRSPPAGARITADAIFATPSVAPVIRSTPGYVELRLALAPPDAAVYVDDQPLGPAAQFVRDGAAHRLRAQAPGFISQVQLVTFDADIKEVSFKLEPPALQRRGDPRPVRPVKHATLSDKVERASHARPPKDESSPAAAAGPPANSSGPPIDTGDPWRK